MKFAKAILKHSENINYPKNMVFSYIVFDYVYEPKLSMDPFPNISMFDWAHLSGTKVLTRIDTPITKLKRIDAPSPTMSREKSSK